MSRSAMESIRLRLDHIRRRRNRNLALAIVGGWLFAVSVFFTLLVVTGQLLSFGQAAWKIAFVIWLAAVFGLSFLCFWQYRKRWESDRRLVHRVEQELPDLEQRLITSLEFDQGEHPGVSPQLIDRLLADATQRIKLKPLASFASVVPMPWTLAAAGFGLIALLGLLQFSEGFFRATQKLTWAWNPSITADFHPAPVIHVEPGHLAMQRGDDLRIVATLTEARAAQLILHVQDDRLNWRQIVMQAEPDAGRPSAFAAELSQLSENFVYYIEYPGDQQYDATRTPQYQVTLFDLPRVEGIAITYRFPAYTGLEDRQEDPGGDVLAPEGSEILVDAKLNQNVDSAYLVFADGKRLPMTVQDRRAHGSFQVSEDTLYHIELSDSRARNNKNPREHYVRAIKDRPPTISLRSPGRDQRVMPLEEVVFEVKADDDYGLTEFQLVYTVIGGEEKRVDFLADDSAASVTSANGKTLLYLEDLAVQPGDIISYSFAVRDNNALHGPTQVISDIYFLEVSPTDHEFSRARGSGNSGGGGGGGDSSALVRSQKDVIAATWKLRNGREEMEEKRFTADSRVIRDAQAELAQRAQMSISRLTERGSFAEENYENAVRALREAISAMEAALHSLDELALGEALTSEQQALQSIMLAEAQINKTQVALNNSGGGGAQSAERDDLRELFEMELGQLENRYQLPQQQGEDQQAGQNETLHKLEELARRQERLTRSQRELARREEQLSGEHSRRQLEQLRREQEQLQQELAELAQSRSQQASQQASGESGQQRSGSSQNSNALQQALQEMQEAARSESPSQAAAKSQKALDALRREAAREEAGARRSLAQLQEAVKQRSEELLQRQRQLQRDVEHESRSRSLSSSRDELAQRGTADSLLEQRQDLRVGVDELARDLRQIASGAGDDRQREARETHDLARALRPIQDKMETSQQIMERGMLNLSLRIESDIESELADIQQRIQSLGTGSQQDAGGDQLADQLAELRESLQELQQQLAQATPTQAAQGDDDGGGQGDSGDGSGSSTAGREQMEQSLGRSRELARDLARMAAGTEPWSASAASIRSQLTQQSLDEFLSRPALLASLLQPLVDLERQLRMESELSKIDARLFSESGQNVPEHYKSLVENYYRLLSERRGSQ